MKVATTNLWARNQRPAADARLIESLGWGVVGVNEAHNHLNEILPVWRNTFDIRRPPVARNTRGSNELLILLRKDRDYKILDAGAYKVSEPARPLKIAPERWLQWVRFKDVKDNKFQAINLHPNAAVQAREDGRLLSREIKRVYGWVKSMRALQKEIRRAQADGFTPIVTGDLNYRRYRGSDFVLAYWSPQRIFRRNGMAWREQGLDYVGWGVKGLRYKNSGVIHPSRHGGDHYWLWVDLDAV